MIGLIALAAQPFSLEIDDRMAEYHSCLAEAFPTQAEPRNKAEADTLLQSVKSRCGKQREKLIAIVEREISIHFPNVDARRQAETNVDAILHPDSWADLKVIGKDD